MKTLIKTTLLTTGLILTTGAIAVPNSFSAGQPARADEVNENFADVEAQIAANTAAIASIPSATVYDYNNFATGSNIISKTFATTGLCGNTEVRTIASTPNGQNTDVLVTRRRLDGNTTCQLNDFSYVNTPTERRLVGGRNYASFDDSLYSTKTPASPIIMATSTMSKGATFASGTTVNTTYADGFTPANTTVYVDENVATGLEDVNVTAGNFTGCLKISTIRRSNTFGQFQRISWRCAGYGEVKRIQMRLDGTNGFTWELSSVTTQ